MFEALSRSLAGAAGLTLALLLAASPAIAQDHLDVAINNPVAARLPSTVAAAVGPGVLDSFISLPSGLEINADDDSSEVTLKGAFEFGSTATWLGHLDFTLKGPLDKGPEGQSGALAALKGLGKASSLEVSFNQSRLFGIHALDINNPAFGSICREVAQAHQNAPKEELKNKSPPVCEGDSKRLTSQFVHAYAPKRYREFQSLQADPNAGLFFWGVSGAVGSEKYDFKDPTTFEDTNETETPWSVGGYLAFEHIASQTLFTLRGEHKRIYELPEKSTKCRDPADKASCIEAAFGPPEKDDVDVVAFEMRRRFGNLGFVASANYDVGADSLVIDVPIYFIPDDEGGFNGGVRATWDSKTDEAKVGFFVSKKFSLFGDL